MERYMDVMRQTTALANTLLEGLEHIKNRINDGFFEDTFILFTDVMEGYSQIEKAIQPLLPQLPQNDVASLTYSLREAFEYTVSAYEEGHGGKVLEISQFTLLPTYKKWKDAVEKTFHPFLVS